MRTPIIAGNWKMNTTVAEALDLVRALKSRLEAAPSVERVVCPPFVSLAAVSAELAGSPIAVGAQNLYWQDKGAFTGEISPLMLKPLCSYVIIGHSERRQYFGETNETVNQKAKAALKAGLKPIVCVGENLAQREAAQTNGFISDQIKQGLDGLESTDTLVVAYEPIWAIGTGRAATGAMAEDVCALIRQTLAGMFGASAAAGVRIQYGGSVTAANVAEFMGQTDIDGALVGGASLKAEEFAKIVELTATVKQGK
jgi:triosephosphate isomerase (TIM)